METGAKVRNKTTGYLGIVCSVPPSDQPECVTVIYAKLGPKKNQPIASLELVTSAVKIPVPTGFFNNVPKDKHDNPAALKTQLEVIIDLMVDSQWHTVQEIAEKTGFPENSVQAQFRNARKLNYVVEREKIDGLSHYRFAKAEAAAAGV